MSKIIYLPFENLPQRYTLMWNEAIIERLSKEKDYLIIGCENNEQKINSGEFLDTYNTAIFKFQELIEVAKLFKIGAIKDGDVFFIPDLWFFGLSSIKYMSELNGIKVKIVTFNHAGRADENDFVQNLSGWADTQEKAWTEMSDLVLVGSEYHKRRVVERFNPKRIEVTGAVWSKAWMDRFTQGISRKKEDYIIFPHRICKEKQFDLFLEIVQSNPSLKFIVTSGGPNRLQQELPLNVEYRCDLTKKEYYEIFAKAKGYLSTAKQETFGYTLQEAIYFNCQVVVPDYACYREYAHRSSIVSFNDMKKEGFLTDLYNNTNLKKSTMVRDNADLFIELIKTL